MELVLLDDFISFKNLHQCASQLLLSLNPVSLPKTQAQGVYAHYSPEAVCIRHYLKKTSLLDCSNSCDFIIHAEETRTFQHFSAVNAVCFRKWLCWSLEHQDLFYNLS